ncbi:glutamyl-tRNA(Gln) amidotransferase subunit A [Nannizzia gypsea CBS 118893]|uniref:Glutamyl-tRNA(Gln) amidotransferase subunit A n=1 Tax=Arthroderma gypseum (strain ATCC MYA-4604 / CBS 118893) TaxID=535722 RepID=E5R167_ARTGP|nr:glutamyl-tRNA(Gln) amidotransferase subunit A [Nannizzia gypsea CBS 118893]EFQ98456.1 glutamyl-tRNA(Gln) amidotransferase subunit A [Nannizzia gypsea CBS 118893]
MKSPITVLLQLGAVYTSIASACKLSDLPIFSSHGRDGLNQCVEFRDEHMLTDRLIDPQACDIPRLIDATADQLQDGLTKGCFTSVDLVNTYVARIAEVNSTVRAVTEINPDALTIARQMDRERKQGKLRGPLHGLPIVIKNNIFTDDKMSSTAGSYAIFGARTSADATVAAKLREAGLVIMGKTGASQWANFRSINSTNGWSAFGGQVTAAYIKNQDPSGSSSGSGVASDLGLAFATLGTETSGSIVSPAEKSNIVGLKPTVGLTSRRFVVPVSERQDTIGPMTRSVKDAAYLLQVIAGKDSNDNYTSAIPFDTIPDYVKACDINALKGKRIGVPRNVIKIFGSQKTAVAQFNQALAVMKKAGAIIVENTDFTSFAEFAQSPIPDDILYADSLTNLPDFFKHLKVNPNNITDLQSLRRFTQHHRLEEYPSRDTARWDIALQKGVRNTDPEFWPMYQKNLKFGNEGGILGTLRRHKLDAAVLPTDLTPYIPALVGSPIITVPMGVYPNGTKVNHDRELVTSGPGIPIGIGFMGDLWSEEKLIGLAYAFEQKTRARPKFKRFIEPKKEVKNIL